MVQYIGLFVNKKEMYLIKNLRKEDFDFLRKLFRQRLSQEPLETPLLVQSLNVLLLF